jgi:tRNA (cytidine/uridine-2'-O-)-methyltransferase
LAQKFEECLFLAETVANKPSFRDNNDMNTQLRLALYQPDQAANTGALMRLCACLGVALDIIEPCGFVLDDRRLKRVAMDYIDHLAYVRHRSWEDFWEQTSPCQAEASAGCENPPSPSGLRRGSLHSLRSRRLVLLTTKADQDYRRFAFRADDILMVGRESTGVPEEIHGCADAQVKIPMQAGLRSLNVAMAAAIVLSEALRQCEMNNDSSISEIRRARA